MVKRFFFLFFFFSGLLKIALRCWDDLIYLKMAGISGRDRPVKASCRFETGLRRFDQVSDR